MCTDTVTMSVMHVVSTTSSNLIEPGVDVATFSRSEIDHRVLGSKLVLVVEQMQCVSSPVVQIPATEDVVLARWRSAWHLQQTLFSSLRLLP